MADASEQPSKEVEVGGGGPLASLSKAFGGALGWASSVLPKGADNSSVEKAPDSPPRDKGDGSSSPRKEGLFGLPFFKPKPSLSEEEKRKSWAVGLDGWVDEQPQIEVEVPKGCFCNLYCKFKVGLHPDGVYGIISDPDNKRIFKNIKETVRRDILEDDGVQQRVMMEQAAMWRFLVFSGTFNVTLDILQNEKERFMKYKLAKSGFMKNFEGSWEIEPHNYLSPNSKDGVEGTASMVTIRQNIQPAMVPPPPFSGYVRGITVQATRDLLRDLQHEAERIRLGKPLPTPEEEKAWEEEKKRQDKEGSKPAAAQPAALPWGMDKTLRLGGGDWEVKKLGEGLLEDDEPNFGGREKPRSKWQDREREKQRKKALT
ncbi:hypothetical protein KFL_002570050 [Klebsormidium nitens]|uniref:DUF220 domain-containing protein n=1 Tax=Klebsormidium nitens TaxID=105231 RepID=A0A1Y1IAU5_KLENI|nr:hypothetical protein KFL_002570050 [Klebsormidium nitens]|eukprot:GAQ85837.1 hypothetical protein KFL_002570050 [Klebsormidium nitens]